MSQFLPLFDVIFTNFRVILSFTTKLQVWSSFLKYTYPMRKCFTVWSLGILWVVLAPGSTLERSFSKCLKQIFVMRSSPIAYLFCARAALYDVVSRSEQRTALQCEQESIWKKYLLDRKRFEECVYYTDLYENDRRMRLRGSGPTRDCLFGVHEIKPKIYVRLAVPRWNGCNPHEGIGHEPASARVKNVFFFFLEESELKWNY